MIRRYQESDLAAVYDVCVRTAAGGGDARGKYQSDDLHIDLLPPFQRAGHGRRLMETFFEAVSRAGAAGVYLVVSKENVNALGFYHRLGLQELPVADPGPVVYMGLKL